MKPIFELSQDPIERDAFHVIANDYDNLELQILFTGSKIEAEDLLDKLQFCQAKGIIK